MEQEIRNKKGKRFIRKYLLITFLFLIFYFLFDISYISQIEHKLVYSTKKPVNHPTRWLTGFPATKYFRSNV